MLIIAISRNNANPQDELCEKILLYLDAPALAVVEQVSRTWRATVHNNLLWKKQLDQRMRNVAIWGMLRKFREPEFNRCNEGQDPTVWKALYRNFDGDVRRVQTNWRSGQCAHRKIEAGGNGIYCFQYDDHKIISGSRDNKIKIWDYQTGHCIRELPGHQGSVLCLQVKHRKRKNEEKKIKKEQRKKKEAPEIG